MATYSVTPDVRENWSDGHHYKYRYRSSAGLPVAQSEFDRRARERLPAFLWRWDWPNRPVLVARHEP